MHRLLVSALLLVLFIVPFSALAADLPLLSPGWHIVPDAHDLDPSCPVGAPLGMGGVLQLIQNVMNAMVSLGVVISVLVIAYAGILWMLTATNPESHSQAKKVLSNAVIGLLIILAAWLMVDFVMKILYGGENNQQGKFGPWNEILSGGNVCVEATTNKPLSVGGIFSRPGQPLPGQSEGTGTGGGGGGGGSCGVQTSRTNPCSVVNMQNSCFASRATDAARICNLESNGGQAAAKSGSDRLDGGKGASYSVGLWQINLTVHKIGGLDCPSAFTHKCGGKNLVGSHKPGACNSMIKPGMVDLYNKCVLAAQDPVKSTAVACTLYSAPAPTGGFQPWAYSANKCSVPKQP